MRFLLGLTFLAVLAAATSDPAPLTWGPVGHSTAAAIAQTLLNSYANQTTTVLLNGSLSDFASWADNVRPYFPWSSGLHFIDTPDWACTYVYNRDCIDKGVLGRCVDGAIQNYTSRTSNPAIGLNQQTQALKFLIHFIGDVHQPLHVSFTSDRGGNDINCTFPGKTKTNLHSLWDSGMLKKRIADDFGGDNLRWASYLVSRMNNPDDLKPFVAGWKWCPAQSLKNACSKTWAGESAALACQYAYSDTDNKPFKAGTAVSTAYYQRAIPIIETQVVKAGVRLANVLNTIFPPK